MNRLLGWAAIAAVSILSACSSADPPSDPPANVAVAPGDTSALVTWTNEEENDYWVFYAEGTELTYENRATQPGYRSQLVGEPPYLIVGLTNGKTYSVMVGKTQDGSAVGPTTTPVTVTPRLAGDTWAVGTPLPVASLNGVAFGNSIYVAVGAGGAIFTSSDGASWTARASGTTNDLHGVLWMNNARFVAVGANGTTIHSTDAVTWEAAEQVTTRDLYAITDYGDAPVAVGAGGTILVSASGGLGWTEYASGTSADLYAVATGNARIVAAGAAGTLIYADNPTSTWLPGVSGVAADLRGVRFGNNVFAVVGAGGTSLWSGDGANFGPAVTPATADLRSVAFGSQFVAVGASGAALTSLDGKVWSATSTGTAETLNAVTFGLFRFSAVGTGGVNLMAR